jgi:hypothetical protein
MSEQGRRAEQSMEGQNLAQREVQTTHSKWKQVVESRKV